MEPKKRIIFVDDDPSVLQGLKRRLFGCGQEWDMSFASSGAEALRIMKDAPFDVIVSDMRMPEMDGATLLEQVRQSYPQTARIGLSGQSDQEMIIRAIGPTHQYLSKPCNPDVLKNAITRACRLREYLMVPALRQLVTGMPYLPSLPGLYLELTAEVTSSQASLAKISGIISRDISMTAKILQIVNSEFFGLTQRITSAEAAVNYLGLEVIRALLLSLNVFASGGAAGAHEEIFSDLWSHSLRVAVCARQIANAERAGEEIASQSFTAGLLHDIGKLVIRVNLPEQYNQIVRLMKEKNLLDWDAEREVVGASHEEIGAYLLGLWTLPDSVVEAVAFHHSPEKCGALSFLPLTAVHIADCLVHEFYDSGAAAALQCRLDSVYLGSIGLAEHLEDWKVLSQVTLEEDLGPELRCLPQSV